MAQQSVNGVWMLNNRLQRARGDSLDLPGDPEALLEYRSYLSAELTLVERKLQALGGYSDADGPGRRRADG